MRIAVFDYRVDPVNPIGSCHRRMLAGLCDEHDFTVFSVRFDNPRPDRIRWVRVPAVLRPLALLFVTFHVAAPIAYLWDRLRGGGPYDLVQYTESNLSFGQVNYSHFSHRSYLRLPDALGGGIRGIARWLDHALHALIEPLVYRTAKVVVTPSAGMARELEREHPATRGRTHVIPNAVDVARLAPSGAFDRLAVRRSLGVAEDDLLLIHMALGHYVRKGMPQVLEALDLVDERVKLVAVGATDDLAAAWRRRAERAGLGGRAHFLGRVPDIRPYLWAADAFVLPSAYEAFSLVMYEAAAAGLPLVCSGHHGVSELLREGRNGYLVERTGPAVAEAVRRLLAMAPEDRAAMGAHARQVASSFTEQAFVDGWRAFYAPNGPGGRAARR